MIAEPDGGGGGGGPGDPLAGLVMPPGDPDALAGIAAQLASRAQTLGSGAAGQRSASASVVGSAWIGPAAHRSGASISALASACSYLADAADHATSTLRTCESAWNEAKALWAKAQNLAAQAMQEEQAHRQGGATAATAPGASSNPAALAQARAAADGSDGFTSPDRTQAITLGQQAVKDATQAITAAASSLGTATASVAVLGPDPATYYATNLNATIGEINDLTITQREAFVKDFESIQGPTFDSTNMFNNIEGVLHFFGDEGAGQPNDWVSWVDATILFGFERGAAQADGQPALPGDNQDPKGIAGWDAYFTYMRSAAQSRRQPSLDQEYALWAKGEEPSTHAGYTVAQEEGAKETLPDYMFANLGAEAYRQSMIHLPAVDAGSTVAGTVAGGLLLGPFGALLGGYAAPGIVNQLLNPQNSGPTYYGGHVLYGTGQVVAGTGTALGGVVTLNPGQVWSGISEAGSGTVRGPQVRR